MNIRVLLIADRAAKTSNVKDFLQQSTSPSFLIHQYDSPRGAMDFLVESNCGVDIVLLDVGTVDRENAENVFRQVHALVADIPTIILTGATENDLAMLLMKDGASNSITRETFTASPERLKNAIQFTLSRNDILKKRTGMSLTFQETSTAELVQSEESVAMGSKYVHEQYLSNIVTQPRAGIWLNGGYYVSTPKTSNIKSAYEKSAVGSENIQNVGAIKYRRAHKSKRIAFELQGKMNGVGTPFSMQLMPHKPTGGPK